ncbi:MAG: 2-C-methyl-D-erythritol 4-phosphate cytidylyltransferase, partial [Bacteroidales bacterium]|nr:2-C-methyl-D-erythritol 4-phosphate cytidylyltransferase [Bacteroidales bacterium]
MKTTAIILAGGKGTRVGATIPKQFIEIKGKPILVYTLEAFERHPLIDQIIVICIEGWEETVRSYSSLYSISKLQLVISGGTSALDSIKRGIKALKCDDNDVLVIHEGVRPLVDEMSINKVLND